ncbi:hypothetical protein OKW41_003822 [Paraburkholderia sp. UCT70]
MVAPLWMTHTISTAAPKTYHDRMSIAHAHSYCMKDMHEFQWLI